MRDSFLPLSFLPVVFEHGSWDQSPKVMPSPSLPATRSKSGGTVRDFPTTSSSGRPMMSGGANATIFAEVALAQQVDGLAAKARRQHAVETGRRTTTLGGRARRSAFLAPSCGKRVCHARRDTAEAFHLPCACLFDEGKLAALRKRASAATTMLEVR